MAKKFGKFLLFSAVAGAAIAGTYYYLQNKNSSFSDDSDDDDFDDFSDDFDDDTDDTDKTRNYVDLNTEKPQTAESSEAKDITETADASEVKDTADSSEAKVEEFFDDEDDNSADSI